VYDQEQEQEQDQEEGKKKNPAKKASLSHQEATRNGNKRRERRMHTTRRPRSMDE
jgi:hypothetical protein